MKSKDKAPEGFFRHRRSVLFLFLFVAALSAMIALSACGGDGSSSSSSTESETATTTESEGEAEGGSSENAAGEGEASSEPLKVWSAAGYTTEGTAAFEETKFAAEASVKAINAAGGVAGHPIELETCDDHLTPNGAQSCWQKAASDSSSIAMVGGDLIYGEAVAPIATQAGLASVGGMGVEGERTEPIFFVQTPGFPNTYFIAAQNAVEEGAKKVAFYGVEIPGTEELLEHVEEAVEEGGAELSANVQIPVTEASTAAASSKVLASHPEAVIMEVSALQTTSAVRDMRREGFEGPIYIQTTLFSEEGLEAFAKYKNLIGFQGMPPTNEESIEGVASFNQAMDKYASSAPRTELALMNWLAFNVFKQVAENIKGEITRESFLKQIEETSELDTEGLTAEVPGWYTGTAPYSALPRLFNNHGVIVTIEKGKLVWNKTWYPGLGRGEQESAG